MNKVEVNGKEIVLYKIKCTDWGDTKERGRSDLSGKKALMKNHKRILIYKKMGKGKIL